MAHFLLVFHGIDDFKSFKSHIKSRAVSIYPYFTLAILIFAALFYFVRANFNHFSTRIVCLTFYSLKFKKFMQPKRVFPCALFMSYKVIM